jgi:galactose mutarotase-like enzyme
LRATISNGRLEAVINYKGAELISLKNHSGREFIWEGNPEFWGKHSPVLFPIVGTLKNNTYLYKNKEYSLSRHGFARDMEFVLEHKTDASATFLLRSDENTSEVYPFGFEFRIIYTLSGKKLEIAYQVSNIGNDMLYFSLGAHPAFALRENFENYSLEIHSEKPLVTNLLENDLLSDKTITLELQNGKLGLNYTLFEKDALIFKSAGFHSVTLLENQKPLLQVNFEDFPDLGLWTKTNAHFLCIEPWFGHSDAINSNQKLEEKPGIIAIKAAENFNTQFNITLL